VKALKFLAPGAVGRFSGFAWPRPSAHGPGAWVEAADMLASCMHGIHVCLPAHVPYWMDSELWLVELGGERIEASSMVVSRRARLLRPVEDWSESALGEFGEFCLRRARDVAERALREGREKAAFAHAWANDVETYARSGKSSVAAYVAAVAAHVISNDSPEAAYAAERRVQAEWLSKRFAFAQLLVVGFTRARHRARIRAAVQAEHGPTGGHGRA
jgi:hypothetical protein